MKLKLNAFEIIGLGLLTILFILDFFQNNVVSKYINNGNWDWILVISLVILMLLVFIKKPTQTRFQAIFTPVYIVVLLIVLTLLGGESAYGFSATQDIFWIIVVISIIDITLSIKNKTNQQS